MGLALFTGIGDTRPEKEWEEGRFRDGYKDRLKCKALWAGVSAIFCLGVYT